MDELFHEKNGMIPRAYRSASGVVGNDSGVHGRVVQSKKGLEKLSSERFFPVRRSKLESAFKSHGGAVPVNWVPIHAPQYKEWDREVFVSEARVCRLLAVPLTCDDLRDFRPERRFATTTYE
jgi:hypothetical protein